MLSYSLEDATVVGTLLLTLAVAVCIARFLSVAVYNVFLHPLRKFPGPKTAAATPFPFASRVLNGRMIPWIASLHERYGEIVRIHPNELSFVGSSAWQDIYAIRPEFPREQLGTIKWPNGVPPLPIITNTEDHTRQRRILSHAFSDRALREQEYLLHKHSDTLITALRDHTAQRQAAGDIDICSWYYFTTFDIIGDLCFSEPFHCLESEEYHPLLLNAFEGIKFGKSLTAFDHFPPLGDLIRWCLPKSVRAKSRQTFDWTREKISQRLKQNADRQDFLKYVLENNHKQGMTRDEMDSTISILLLTGSGLTTATAMAAVTYFALQNPRVMHRLQKEIRGAVGDTAKNITVAAVSDLKYLDAVVREAMRMHPPSPNSNPKVVDRPGVTICGHAVPQGTRVGIPQKPAYRLAANFVDPLIFLPERWLPEADPRFAADDKGVFEPFLVGSRSCIAKTLALAEVKLIIAKVFWNFDLVLSEKNHGDWSDQRTYLINEKTPLYVKLRPRD